MPFIANSKAESGFDKCITNDNDGYAEIKLSLSLLLLIIRNNESFCAKPNVTEEKKLKKSSNRKIIQRLIELPK
jgi:hypothetical protein